MASQCRTIENLKLMKQKNNKALKRVSIFMMFFKPNPTVSILLHFSSLGLDIICMALPYKCLLNLSQMKQN